MTILKTIYHVFFVNHYYLTCALGRCVELTGFVFRQDIGRKLKSTNVFIPETLSKPLSQVVRKLVDM